MRTSIAAALLLAVSLLPATASALATLTAGNAGDTWGVRADAPGVAYVNAGCGRMWNNPSADVRVLGGGDLVSDATLDSEAWRRACLNVNALAGNLGQRATV